MNTRKLIKAMIKHFFFQAEDGIRDGHVTGVQTCALPILDVDYQANLNLLEEAKRNGVKKFVYVSVFQGQQLTQLEICKAKEKFVAALTQSGMTYCVIRPTGFFTDMSAFYRMAEKGRVFLFGDGSKKMNPIHGADLAKICVEVLRKSDLEITVGGPEVFTFNQMAEMAFSIADKKTKITHIPKGIKKTILFLLRNFSSSKFYGPLEFLFTVLTMDSIAPEYGCHHLKAYFHEIQSARD